MRSSWESTHCRSSSSTSARLARGKAHSDSMKRTSRAVTKTLCELSVYCRSLRARDATALMLLVELLAPRRQRPPGRSLGHAVVALRQDPVGVREPVELEVVVGLDVRVHA